MKTPDFKYDFISLKITSIGIVDENVNSGHVFVKKNLNQFTFEIKAL